MCAERKFSPRDGMQQQVCQTYKQLQTTERDRVSRVQGSPRPTDKKYTLIRAGSVCQCRRVMESFIEEKIILLLAPHHTNRTKVCYWDSVQKASERTFKRKSDEVALAVRRQRYFHQFPRPVRMTKVKVGFSGFFELISIISAPPVIR